MLTLITTPIGNLADISQRSKQAMEEAEILACEDTRTTKKLISLLGLHVNARLLPYHDHNGAEMRPKILDALQKGKKVGLVSDAGTPLISDPGYKLVQEARDLHLPVTATSGACAPILALILSGLPSDRFLFHGFLPEKGKAASQWLEDCQSLRATSLFFVSPSQLEKHLTLIADKWGNRQMALVREITKLHEEVRRGPILEILAEITAGAKPKGELVLVIAPPEKTDDYTDDEIRDLLEDRLQNLSLKDAVAEVASLSGKGKKTVYQMALEIKG